MAPVLSSVAIKNFLSFLSIKKSASVDFKTNKFASVRKALLIAQYKNKKISDSCKCVNCNLPKCDEILLKFFSTI